MSCSSSKKPSDKEPFVGAHNACKLCSPLGASLVFKGVEGCVPFLHGSQGCATYIRRYLISHFREPIDIASSNFSEEAAVFGGRSNFSEGITNVRRQYFPSSIGIATTCLSETIGEDMAGLIHDYLSESWDEEHPKMIHVSTPSYKGTHIEGFHAAVRALVESLALPAANPEAPRERIAVFPGMVSTADLRFLHEVMQAFEAPYTLLPDYSETMDGGSWSDYQKVPGGGTPLNSIAALGHARAAIEFGRTIASSEKTAAAYLASKHGVERHAIGLPFGIRESDVFFERLESITGRQMPAIYQAERGRLVDAYVDGHKYVFGKKVVLYGDQDFVVALAAFLSEIGMVPVICASGAKTGQFESAISRINQAQEAAPLVMEGADYNDITENARFLKPDMLIGCSKGYPLARELGIPLVRMGFPVHDRMGGQRVLHLGYRGAQTIFDNIVNTILDARQEQSEVGFSYM